MTTCTHLSDRMPDVALGRARWTPDEARHLARCEDCRAEWAVVSAGSRLGSALPVADPASIAARALERIRHERARARIHARMLISVGLAAAAVLALAVWAGREERGATRGARTVPVPAPVAANPPTAAPGIDSQVQRGPEPKVAEVPAASPGVEMPFPELDSLPAEALDSMLQAIDEPIAHVGAYDLPPDESGDRELEQVLAGLEG
jgi:hypothetical protein